MSPRGVHPSLLGLVGVAIGCAGPAREGAGPEVPKSHSEATFQTPTTIVSPDQATDVEEVLTRADAALEDEDFDAAEKHYRLALEHARSRERRLRALLGLATSLDLGAQPGAALGTYSRYLAEAPVGAGTEAIRVRKVRLLLYLEKYEEAGHESAAMSLSERTPLQQVVIFAARASASVARGDLDSAERHISKGRAVVDAHSLDRVTVPPLDVAALYFAQGEVYRLRAEAIEFDPVPPDFTDALERRCQFLLDAQGSYSEVMRSHDAHYSSMAGVKVGRLYRDLHADLTSMPVPPAADTKERQRLFEGALRLRYSILLTKALAMLRATVDLMERSSEPSRWREEAKKTLEQIESAQVSEQAALDALPYSREQLQQVLDEMAARARGPRG